MDFHRFDHLETLEPAAVKHVQEALLKQHLDYIAQSSTYYQRLLGQSRIPSDKITLENLGAFPLTDKSDLEEHNDDFCAVPLSEIKEIVLSSGTTGKPTRMMYTEDDLLRLAYNEETAFSRIGVTADDVVLLTCTMDRCFIAGLAYYSGTRALGAAAVRNGLNTVASHMELIQEMKPTVVVGVPSFLHKLGLAMKGRGVDPRSASIRKLICIGEPVRNKELSRLKRCMDLEELWAARVFSTYASSETITTFCECPEQAGGHLHPALGLVEIIDENGKRLPSGEVGEVVVTPLLIQGMPFLRFKTGDISFLIDKPCACGRTSLRLGPVLGRKRQMIKYQGTTFYPQAIYSVLDEIREVSEYYVVVSGDYLLSDHVQVVVSIQGETCSAGSISDRLQARLRGRPEVVVGDEAEVRSQVYAENSRKPVRFIDKRERSNGMS